MSTRLADLATITLLAGGLCLPAVQSAFHVAPATEIAEKRTLEPVPAFDIRQPMAAVRGWSRRFDVNFGLRDLLVRWDTTSRLRLLGSLPVSKLIAGRDGWIFYDAEKAGDGNSIGDFRGLAAYPPARLDAIVALLRGRARWCERHGTRYLLVVAPNKETVYPEFLPASLRRIGPITRLDQVSSRLSGDRPTLLLDLRGPLVAAKALYPEVLYNKGGTHWNQFGAYIGFRAIVAAVRETVPGPPAPGLEAFRVEVDPASDEDHWLGLPDNRRYSFVPTGGSPGGGATGPKVLVVHDSFMDSLAPFLRLQFPGMVAVHVRDLRGSLEALVEREKPAIVIQLTAERYEDRVWSR